MREAPDVKNCQNSRVKKNKITKRAKYKIRYFIEEDLSR